MALFAADQPNRSNYMVLRVTRAEREVLKALAGDRGMTASAFLRSVIVKALCDADGREVRRPSAMRL